MPRRNESGRGRRGGAPSSGKGKRDSAGRPGSRTSAQGGRPKTGKTSSPNRRSGTAKSYRSSEADSSRTPGRFSRGTGTSPGRRPSGGRGARDGEKAAGRSRQVGESTGARTGSFGKAYKKTYKSRPRSTAGRKTKAELAESAPATDKIRLNKFIANSGVASRREADELITMGLISVNGKVVTELGFKVNPGDEVRYEDRVLRPEKPVYILMNKPKGFITTTDDPHDRKTVMHIIGNTVKQRIYPVGRLDRNTTGLLLLTNDGDLADKLMHPSFNVKKVYKVELDRALTKSDLKAIMDGVRLEEGRAEVDDVAIVSEDGKTVGIELHIGWNRVVRRIFEQLGYEVVKLDRTVYAGLDKKDLGRGQWRFLTRQEIIQLKHFK